MSLAWTLVLTLSLIFQQPQQCRAAYKFGKTEMAILNAFNTMFDVRNEFLKHVMEAASLPVLAPILVRSGAIVKGITQDEVQKQLQTAGLGTVLHGLSLLPITLPVSALHLLSAPMAVPYRRRIGRAVMENGLRKEIEVAIKELQELAALTDRYEYRHNFVNIVPQPTLEHSSNHYTAEDVLKTLKKPPTAKLSSVAPPTDAPPHIAMM